MPTIQTSLMTKTKLDVTKGYIIIIMPIPSQNTCIALSQHHDVQNCVHERGAEVYYQQSAQVAAQSKESIVNTSRIPALKNAHCSFGIT
ncbi:hypothetical protein RRG08_033961 [Elysia crispata]|uniref:Uncharacterized protein n=1 Tax=Elysia crispata TaxID=231223 RepID=A0AAE0YRL5_9GAST|nr:hypothetical protein RRG08_033961 [Elysia crispata]